MEKRSLDVIEQYNNKANEYGDWQRSFFDLYSALVLILNADPEAYEKLNENARRILGAHLSRVSEDLNENVIEKMLDSEFLEPMMDLYWLHRFKGNPPALQRLMKKLLDNGLVTHGCVKRSINAFSDAGPMREAYEDYLYGSCKSELAQTVKCQPAAKAGKVKFI